MRDAFSIDIHRVLPELASNPHELEWVEFKENNTDPQEIGEYLSALANAAALHDERRGFLAWGVRDGTHEIVGTTFSPHDTRRGGELLVPWLARLLNPRLDFRFHEGDIGGSHVVLLEIPAATHMPVRFAGEEFIRVGSTKRKLKDYPDKERGLWERFTRTAFENGIARADLGEQEALAALDFAAYFDLVRQPVPTTSSALIARMRDEGFALRNANGRYDVTNLGAISFGKPLQALGLERKAVRIIVYKGEDRFETRRERVEPGGYAAVFESVMQFIATQLPENEHIGQALRQSAPMYPELALRELVANALIHQDLLLAGTGPTIEIFESRIEITNPGRPLIEPLRFLDLPPRSRNERLASLMRRFGICEERGSGIDKVVRLAELYQLPAPDFRVTPEHTVAVLYAPRPLGQMGKEDRVRACYQHAALQWLANRQMTNASLRARFGISGNNAAIASRIIGETLEAELIKPYDPENRSRKHAKYVPFWA